MCRGSTGVYPVVTFSTKIFLMSACKYNGTAPPLSGGGCCSRLDNEAAAAMLCVPSNAYMSLRVSEGLLRLSACLTACFESLITTLPCIYHQKIFSESSSFSPNSVSSTAMTNTVRDQAFLRRFARTPSGFLTAACLLSPPPPLLRDRSDG